MKYFTWGDISNALIDKLRAGEKLTDIEKSVLDLMEKQKRVTEDLHRQKRAASMLRAAHYRGRRPNGGMPGHQPMP